MSKKEPPFKFGDQPRRPQPKNKEGNPLILYIFVVMVAVGLYSIGHVLWGAI